jgi:hypothetical protein
LRAGTGGREVEGDLRRDAGIFRVEAELVFLLGGGGVVAEGREAAGDVGPDRAEGEKIFFEERFAAARDAEGVRAVERADAGRAGFETVLSYGDFNLILGVVR